MSAKRIIIITLISILILLLAIGGINMYKRLKYNKLAHETDIYTFIPADANPIARINNNQGLQNTYQVNFAFSYIIEPLKKHLTFPFFILNYDGNDVLMAKVNPENEDRIKEIIQSVISTAPYPSQLTYKDATILLYGMPENMFIACTFHKGILAVSTSYKSIEKVLDTGDHSFFADKNIEKLQNETKRHYPSDIFYKSDSIDYMLGVNLYSDTLIYEGYIRMADSTQMDIIQLIQPDIVYYNIAEMDTTHEKELIFLRIALNKMPEITFNN